jgi:hypothetical protein
MTSLRESKLKKSPTLPAAPKPATPRVRGTKNVRAAASLVRKLYQPALDELAK